jgi:leucyl-tRNA---protein transferase
MNLWPGHRSVAQLLPEWSRSYLKQLQLERILVCEEHLHLTVERRNFPHFFITAASPCPYLDGRQERKVFTHLVGAEATDLNSKLSQGGFRRSQNIAYRPSCDGCQSCVSVRVPVKFFDWTTSFNRVLKRNRDIVSAVAKSRATSEHYSVFRGYIDERHAAGGMSQMSVLDFAAMVDDSYVDSRIAEFRYGPSHESAGELVGAALIDILGDGLSMIYSFYEPDLDRRSLGTLMVLDTIRRAERMGLPYVYLGYWIKGSAKMDYKGRFLPQERLSTDGWRLHEKD